jgi:hypothetical protein
MSDPTDDALARAGIRIAGFVSNDDISNSQYVSEAEFKDTVPIGELSSDMVTELVSAFCRDTRHGDIS